MAQDGTAGDDRTGRPPRRRALPESALAGLREAFAGEVATRLPRLQRLTDDPDVVAQALRDAHTLGSSAVVVGELEASRCARALEVELAAHAAGAPSAAGALPPSAHAHVQMLTVLLSPWLAA